MLIKYKNIYSESKIPTGDIILMSKYAQNNPLG